ncbi:NAD(P)H-dependent oxidoreductase subunit E [Shigella flexneri]
MGRHSSACDSVVCHINGHQGLPPRLEEAQHQSRSDLSDGRFTLLPSCCLGNCDEGPTIMIHEDTHAI